jgi:hypothetical protein
MATKTSTLEPSNTPVPEAVSQADPMAEAPTVLNGKIALIWDPTRDTAVAPSVGTATPIRTYHYSLVAGYAQQSENRAIPQFVTLDFRLVGRNWIDNELWQQAKAQSKQQSNDPLGRLLRLRAIREFVPIVGTLTGTLSDYSIEDAQELILGVFDVDVLRAEQKAEQRPELVTYIAQRIRDLESGDVR